MPDKNNQEDGPQKRSEQECNKPPKPLREVIVRHEDEPPPAGKRGIHPRRPAPIVPDRKQKP
jgi:hypothetical protein